MTCSHLRMSVTMTCCAWHSVQFGVDCRWCQIQESCSSPGVDHTRRPALCTARWETQTGRDVGRRADLSALGWNMCTMSGYWISAECDQGRFQHLHFGLGDSEEARGPRRGPVTGNILSVICSFWHKTNIVTKLLSKVSSYIQWGPDLWLAYPLPHP